MSDPIGPGDWVECAPPADYRGEVPPESIQMQGDYPRRGRIYCVRGVGTYRALSGEVCAGLRLVGIIASVRGHPDAYWAAEAFRPVYRPRAGAFDHLKAPPKKAPVQKEPAFAGSGPYSAPQGNSGRGEK